MRIFKSHTQRSYFAQDQGELPPLFKTLFQTIPGEVVLLENTQEVVEVVRAAYRNGTPILARGAASSAFGQTIPVQGGIVLDLNFCRSVLRFDKEKGFVAVESGIRWADLDAFLRLRGCSLCSYPSSWYSTVGGWVATGGLGIGSLKFGSLKSQVAELRVCHQDGRTQRLFPGDPLFDAYFETEGQMGVVLDIVLKVRSRSQEPLPFLLEFETLQAAWEGYAKVLTQPSDVFHSVVYNRERMLRFSRALEEDRLRKGLKTPAELNFGEAPAVLAALDRPEDKDRFTGWAKAQGIRLAPDFKAAYVWNERFYPLKGKKENRMFLGSEILVARDRAQALAAAWEETGASEGVLPALEGSAAGRDQVLLLASFYAPADVPSDYAAKLALAVRMDRQGSTVQGGRLYQGGIYHAPHLKRRFAGARIAQLRSAKDRLDPSGLFNPGKLLSMKTAFLPSLPSWLTLAGASLVTRALAVPFFGVILARLAAPIFGQVFRKPGDSIVTAARECVRCGFCLSVCPAYLATRDERTTARGKLHLFTHWAEGGSLSDEDVVLLHSCMHCGGCTAVCQSVLDLVPVWDALESRVEEVHGRPKRAIIDFVKEVEENADYRRLLRLGLISEYRPAISHATSPHGRGARRPQPEK